jgi:hypothetical protein
MLKQTVRAEVARATGHRYSSLERAVENMEQDVVRDLLRLIQNLKAETQREKRLRQTGQFWRR